MLRWVVLAAGKRLCCPAAGDQAAGWGVVVAGDQAELVAGQRVAGSTVKPLFYSLW